MTESVYSTGAAGETEMTNRSAHKPNAISSGLRMLLCVCVAPDLHKQTRGKRQRAALRKYRAIIQQYYNTLHSLM